ncbi:2,3-dihydro-2,3-dihydroxybenzoate dehydrogenase [Micromonospora sonneratiae]|uniref:2,3-dihydro-2,3-dihydroxybenzoate dehydrogenase n=1 Tax=Micromonospora sonneratiae TaxID=1184706 RepID=A0ABW3YN26_9ACTN
MRQSGIAGVTALVTGAGQGIGLAVARALLTHGARVAAVDRDPEGVDRLAEEHPDAVVGYRADVAQPAEIDAVVDAAERELGPIGILANVAGVLRGGPVVDYRDEDWAATFAVNTSGVFHTSRAVARRMVPRRRGAIVTVASNAAGVPRVGMAAYAASKAAATMFTKCLGLELAEHGIRCNVVAPGSTDTPMQRALWTEEGPARVIAGAPDTYRVGIPLGRLAEPDDIADAVVFLVSDQARHITMHDLYVDGGATLRA